MYGSLVNILVEGKLEQAKQLALKVHAGQTRRTSGKPYIVHPKSVYKMCKKMGLSKFEQIVALLHDTIEDSKNPRQTEVEIKQMFGGKVMRLVKLLSHAKSKSYSEYVLNLAKKSRDALDIKLCDMYVNLTDNPTQRQKVKYFSAIKHLKNNGIKIHSKFEKLFASIALPTESIEESTKVQKMAKGLFSVVFYGDEIGTVRKHIDKYFGESWIAQPEAEDADEIEAPTKKLAVKSLVKWAT